MKILSLRFKARGSFEWSLLAVGQMLALQSTNGGTIKKIMAV